MSIRSANAIALVALFIALSGSAYALQGKNTVNSGDIKNNTVKGKDIKKDTVKSSDLKDGGVKGADVKANTLKGAQIDEASLVGLQGGTGETVVSGGHVTPLAIETLAQTPAGRVELTCTNPASMRFTNETDEGAWSFESTRAIDRDDDGVANNGELAMSVTFVPAGGNNEVSLAGGSGVLGSSELTVAAEGTALIASARVFRTADGCEYTARVDHAPSAG